MIYDDLDIDFKNPNTIFLKQAPTEKLSSLFDKGLDISNIESFQVFILLESSDYERTSLLLENGLDITNFDSSKNRHFIESSNIEKIKLFVKYGLNINNIGFIEIFGLPNVDNESLSFLFENGLDLVTLDSDVIPSIIKNSDIDKLAMLLSNGLSLQKLDSGNICSILKDNDVNKINLLLDSGLMVSEVHYMDAFSLLFNNHDNNKLDFLYQIGLDPKQESLGVNAYSNFPESIWELHPEISS